MIELTLETEGIQQLTEMLNALQTLGSQIKEVALHSRNRKDSEFTNAGILYYLKDTKRDFIKSSASDNEEIAKAAAEELEKLLGKAFSQKAVLDNWVSKGLKNTFKNEVNQATAKMFIAAMKQYMSQVTERINQQKTNAGPFDAKLNEYYEEQKKKAVGFAYPIGKYTGQLLDNLNPDGLGARNIRLKK